MLITNVSQASFSIGTSKIILPGKTLTIPESLYLGDLTVRAQVNDLDAGTYITVSSAPGYYPLGSPIVPTVRAVDPDGASWVEFYDDGTSAIIDLTVPTAPTVTAGVGGPGVHVPFLQNDSPDPVIRKVSTAARPATSAAAGDFLACVDPGAWGNDADSGSHMSFAWQVGNVATQNDPSWADVDTGTDFADGTFCHVTQSGKYYRCVVSFTNSAGSASAVSNAIGPVA